MPAADSPARSTARLWYTWLGLVGFAALSLGASRLPLGGFGLAVALIIATIKAALVMLVFMELAGSTGSVRLALAAAALLLVILLGLAVADVVSRHPPRLSRPADAAAGPPPRPPFAAAATPVGFWPPPFPGRRLPVSLASDQERARRRRLRVPCEVSSISIY